jgi:hypothetical protein
VLEPCDAVLEHVDDLGGYFSIVWHASSGPPLAVEAAVVPR